MNVPQTPSTISRKPLSMRRTNNTLHPVLSIRNKMLSSGSNNGRNSDSTPTSYHAQPSLLMAIIFSPDGQFTAAVGFGQVVHLEDSRSSTAKWIHEGSMTDPRFSKFSPGSSLLHSVNGWYVQIRDVVIRNMQHAYTVEADVRYFSLITERGTLLLPHVAAAPPLPT